MTKVENTAERKGQNKKIRGEGWWTLSESSDEFFDKWFAKD